MLVLAIVLCLVFGLAISPLVLSVITMPFLVMFRRMNCLHLAKYMLMVSSFSMMLLDLAVCYLIHHWLNVHFGWVSLTIIGLVLFFGEMSRLGRCPEDDPRFSMVQVQTSAAIFGLFVGIISLISW